MKNGEKTKFLSDKVQLLGVTSLSSLLYYINFVERMFWKRLSRDDIINSQDYLAVGGWFLSLPEEL